MTKKKILFIWIYLPVGGAEKALINLIEALSYKYEITLLLCQNKIDSVIKKSDIKIKTISNLDKRNCKIILYSKYLIIFTINILKNDVTVVYETSMLTLFVGVINKFLPFKKGIYWVHFCKSELQQSKSFLINSLLKNILSRASTCVCVSETAKKSLTDYIGYNKNVHQIYNLSEENSFVETFWNSITQNITISALGRLSKEKGFDVLIEALNKVINEMNFKKIILKIAGDGPEYENLKLLIRKYDITEYVILFGFVSEPLTFINESDIFISSSQSESLGYNVIEALQCKKPVIVTDTGAAEIVEYGKYGIVVEKNNPKALADAIYELAMNPLKREELSSNAHLALKKFDSKKIIEQWIDIIEN